MKRLIALLLLVTPLFAQKSVVQTDDLYIENMIKSYARLVSVYHVYGGFQDSAVTISITKDQWSMVTNAGNNLWSSTGYDGFNVVGDTMVFQHAGTYFGIVSLVFEGNQGNEYEYRMYNVTQSKVEGFAQGQTGRGTGSYSSISQPIYFSNISIGDKVIMQVTNKSGSNSAILKFGGFYAMYLHE